MSEATTSKTVAINPTDEDFDDLALFAGVQGDAEEYRTAAAERDNRAPISYIDEGNYWLRFYPEVKIEADGARRLHVMRRFWSYTGLAKGVRRLPAPQDPSDPVRKEVMRLKDAKYPDAWKFMAKEEGLIKVCIFKSSLPKDHKYIKTETPMYLVLRRKQLTALSEFLADLSPDDLRRILNPRRAAPMIKMSFSKGSGGSSSFGFDIKEAELPALPEDFPSMFKVLIEEGKEEPANDEELMKIRKSISAILASTQNLINPEEGEESGAPPANRSEASKSASAKSAVADALREAKGAGSEAPAAGEAGGEAADTSTGTTQKVIPIKEEKPDAPGDATPYCPSDDPNRKFGAHDATHVDCITCPIEDKCDAATITDVPL